MQTKLIIYIKAIRAHHWAKNFLILTPGILSHQITNKSVIISALIAFIAFSFIASIGYLVNDILDLKSDKLNKYKSNRALASGDLNKNNYYFFCLLYTSPSPRDKRQSRMPSSA